MKFPLLAVTSAFCACLAHLKSLQDNNGDPQEIVLTRMSLRPDLNRAFGDYPPNDAGLANVDFKIPDGMNPPNTQEYLGLFMIAAELERIRSGVLVLGASNSLEDHMRDFIGQDANTIAAKNYLKTGFLEGKKYKKLNYGSVAIILANDARNFVPFEGAENRITGHDQYDSIANI